MTPHTAMAHPVVADAADEHAKVLHVLSARLRENLGLDRGMEVVVRLRYVVRVSEINSRVPVPPDGLRPGQLGVVVVGRVIIGDVAATLVDLAVRGLLRIDEDTTVADGGWLLTLGVGARSRSSESSVEYEQILIGGVAGAGKMGSLSVLASRLPDTLEKTRHAIIRDAVRRGWLHHLHHEERTEQGDELVVRIRAFQRDLRHLKSAEGPQAFSGRLLPYALHFGLTDPSQDLLVRFAHAFTATFADLPGWRPPEHTRPPMVLSEVLEKPSIDEQMMDPLVGAGVWLTGW